MITLMISPSGKYRLIKTEHGLFCIVGEGLSEVLADRDSAFNRFIAIVRR